MTPHLLFRRHLKAWAASRTRLGLSLLGVIAACSGAPEPGYDSGAVGALPFQRAEQQARFWSAHGISLQARFERDWVPLGTPATLILTIQNRGEQELRLPWKRLRGVFPFRSHERGHAYLDVEHTEVSVQWGRVEGTKRIPQPVWSEKESVIPPFSQLSFRQQLPFSTDPSKEYAKVTATAFLLPLSVIFEHEAEKFSPLRFPSCSVHFAPKELFPLRPWNKSTLWRCVNERPRLTVALAAALAEQDRIEVTDRLIELMPGPNLTARDSLLTALRLVTALDLGREVELWRSWWESEQGVIWAVQHRRTD